MDNSNNMFINWDEQGDNGLLGSLFSGGANDFNNAKDVLEDNTSFKSLDEINYDSKYGTKGKCGEYRSDFYEGQSNIKLLIADLRENKVSGTMFFYYEKYISNLPKKVLSYADQTGNLHVDSVPVSIPFTYSKRGGMVSADLNVSLNFRACHVNVNNPGLVFRIAPKSEEIYFILRFTFADAMSKRNFDNATEIKNDFSLDNQFDGIQIKCKNAQDFIAVCEQLGYDEFAKKSITDAFINKLIAADDVKELKSLYENLPEFLVEVVGVKLEYAMLFRHFNLLTNYDYDPNEFFTLSGFRDSSTAVIKNLRCMNNYHELLLKDLKDNPQLVKQAYISLDGKSEIEGLEIRNRTIYASFLYALCLINKFEGVDFKVGKFQYGKGYKLDSNIDWGNDINDNVILLKQLKERKEKVTVTQTNGIPGAAYNNDYETEDTITEDVNVGFYYHPLDIVQFYDNNDPNPKWKRVPAILLKSISDEDEWEHVNRMIRIGIDIAAVILGIISLGESTGFWLALAQADIAVAGADALVQANYEEIKAIGKDPNNPNAKSDGEIFLEGFEDFVLYAGAVTGLPVLAKTIFTSGPKVLAKLSQLGTTTAGASLKFVKTAMMKVVLEIEIANFTKNTVKDIIFGVEALKGTGISFSTAAASRLEKEGVTFIKAINKYGKVGDIAAIYKGEAIASGTAKEVRETLKDLWTARGQKLLDELEKIINRRKIVTLKDASLIGTNPVKGVKMILDLVDEFGNKIGELTRSPNGSELYYKLIQNDKAIDIKCYMKLLDDKYKLNGLPIKDGEHLIYGDFNIPKGITDKYSGLGQIIYEDGLKYFLNAKKYGKVDGTVSVWTKAAAYDDYGGQSINLEQFWKAKDAGMTTEQAAFETFAGKQAKKFGFTRVRIINEQKQITREKVQLNFLK